MFRKIFTSTLLSLVIVGGFFVDVNPHSDGLISFVSETYAAACGGTGQPQCTADQEMANMMNKLIGGINIALDVLTFIVSPAIMLAGWLMSPDWTSGDFFKIRPILHSLWVLVSNITYFIYAILLIFIALATIFNSQNYGYKKLLPRLALGIVLVPLTWWFVQFIISLSTVVTASVMNMPTDIMDKYIIANSSPDTWWVEKSIPEEYEFYTDPGYGAINGESQYNPGNKKSPKEILTDSSGIYGALLVYGNGLFKFSELKRLDTTKDIVNTVAGLANKAILGVVMFIIFGFMVVALIFMLLMRAIKLWFYAIFSPLLTLRYVVGEGLFGGKENADSFEFKEFIGLAFVPALVGLALSFGIMIIALMQNANLGSGNTTCNAADMLPTGNGCKVIGLMGSDQNYILNKVEEMEFVDTGEKFNVSMTEVAFGGIKFRFYGSMVTDINSYSANAATYSSALSATGSVFGTLILDIIALIFLWAGFMAAKNVSSVAKAAFAPFEAIGNKVGKLAMELPKYTPIPGTDGLSISGAGRVVDNASRWAETSHTEKFENTKWGKMFGGERFMSDEHSKKLADAIKSDDKKAIQDLTRLNANRSEGQKGGHVEALGERLRGKSYKEQQEIMQSMGYDRADVRHEISKFMESGTKASLKSDSDKKELWDLMKSAVGASSGGKGANNTSASFTQTASEGLDGKKEYKVSLGDQNNLINIRNGTINEADLNDFLKANKSKWTEEEFKKLLKNSTTITTDVRDKLLASIKPDFFKSPDSGDKPTGVPTPSAAGQQAKAQDGPDGQGGATVNGQHFPPP